MVKRYQTRRRAYKAVPRFRGRGDWWSDFSTKYGRPYGSKILRAVGGGIGTYLGNPGGGYAVGAGASKLLGWGQYGPVATNQIIGSSGRMYNDQQKLIINGSTDRSGDITFSHTEFIGNVTAQPGPTGSSPFTVVSYPVNPAMPQTFPFLSQLAQNFELYRFEGLGFQYKPTSGEFGASSTSNSLGKVILCANYDATAPLFVNSIQMENYQYAEAAKPSCGIYCAIENARSQNTMNMWYTRSGATNKSLNFTDLATFQVATENIPGSNATFIIGELWVTYRVRLSRTQLFQSSLGLNIGIAEFLGTSSGSAMWTPNTTSTKVEPDGTGAMLGCNTLGITLTNLSSVNMRITFPTNISLGYYKITLRATGTNVNTGLFLTSATGCANVQFFRPFDGTFSSVAPTQLAALVIGPDTPMSTTAANPANTILEAIGYFKVTAPGSAQAVFDVDYLTAITASQFSISITQVPQSLGQLSGI